MKNLAFAVLNYAYSAPFNPMVANKPDRLIKIAVARDEFEANVWKDTLEQDGVQPYIKSRDPLMPLGVAPTLPGSFEVYVLARDEKRARWLLGELKPSR